MGKGDGSWRSTWRCGLGGPVRVEREGGDMDRTTHAVRVQLRAMDCDRYEIGLRNSAQGTMIPRMGTEEHFDRGLAWRKHQNAQGHDIYVRPGGSVGLPLPDDLSAAALVRAEDGGFTPAV